MQAGRRRGRERENREPLWRSITKNKMKGSSGGGGGGGGGSEGKEGVTTRRGRRDKKLRLSR